MDVLGIGESRFTADQVLETCHHLATMIQSGMGDSGSVGCEVGAIDRGEAGR